MGWHCVAGSVPAIYKNLTKQYVITYLNDTNLTDRTLQYSTVTTCINTQDNISVRIYVYVCDLSSFKVSFA
jgi:hypothetical protein